MAAFHFFSMLEFIYWNWDETSVFYWIKTTKTTENFDLTLLIKTNLTMSLSNDKSSASNTHFGGLVLVAKVSLCLVDIVASLKRLLAMESMCHLVLALHMAQVVVCFCERGREKKNWDIDYICSCKLLFIFQCHSGSITTVRNGIEWHGMKKSKWSTLYYFLSRWQLIENFDPKPEKNGTIDFVRMTFK